MEEVKYAKEYGRLVAGSFDGLVVENLAGMSQPAREAAAQAIAQGLIERAAAKATVRNPRRVSDITEDGEIVR